MSRGFILRRLGQHHRGVAGQIAVRGVARGRDLDIGEVEALGKRALGLQRPSAARMRLCTSA